MNLKIIPFIFFIAICFSLVADDYLPCFLEGSCYEKEVAYIGQELKRRHGIK